MIIPTLNEEKMLPMTLKKLRPGRHLIKEVLVCDGGSLDRTVSCARLSHCRVLLCEKGREKQMHKGVQHARGDWLFFLFADCYPGEAWQHVVESFIKNSENRLMAASFSMHMRGSFRGRAFVNAFERIKTRLGFIFLDQGLLLSKALYQKTGGFDDQAMGDILYIRRLKKQGLWVFLPHPPMMISGRDWKLYGSCRMFFAHWLIGVLFLLGLSGRHCWKIYHAILGRNKREHLADKNANNGS